ncbi:hypothetical protein EDD22DRAFT_850305 [Suillus occidentalis]|nr:hypothetical protein EDD22DRAFT_850305 [Suillus occidentalis]
MKWTSKTEFYARFKHVSSFTSGRKISQHSPKPILIYTQHLAHSFHIFNRLCDTLVLLASIFAKEYLNQPFYPWLLGTEFVEHFFGLARMLLPDFAYAKLVKIVQHVMSRCAKYTLTHQIVDLAFREAIGPSWYRAQGKDTKKREVNMHAGLTPAFTLWAESSPPISESIRDWNLIGGEQLVKGLGGIEFE